MHEELIKCPECGKIQWGEVEHTWPFYSLVSECVNCAYIITESVWERVTLRGH